jgi:hypothetical protein
LDDEDSTGTIFAQTARLLPSLTFPFLCHHIHTDGPCDIDMSQWTNRQSKNGGERLVGYLALAAIIIMEKFGRSKAKSLYFCVTVTLSVNNIN